MVGKAWDRCSSGFIDEKENGIAVQQPIFYSNQMKGEREPIFTQRATVMLTQLFLAPWIENIPPLLYVRRLLRLGFPAAASHLNAISPELATQFLDLQFNELVLTERFLLSAWGTLSARMRPLLTETVVRSLTSADFQASDLMTGRKPVPLPPLA